MSELPEGWADAPLNDLLEPGGLFDGPFGSNLKTSDYTDAGVRVVRLENLANLRFDPDKHTYISAKKYSTLTKHTVREGDILVGSFVDGAVRVCVLPPLPTRAIAKADCFCVRTRSDLADRRFVAYQLGTSATRDELVEHIHGATRPRITTKQLRALRVRLPPLPEQHRIVAKVEALLDQVDRAKARLDRVPLILKRFRQAVLAAACSGKLTEEWRGARPRWSDEANDFARQLANGARHKEAALPSPAELEFPAGWNVISLDSAVLRLTSGSRAWKPFYRDDGFGTFVMAQNVRPMSFDTSFRQGVAPPASDPEKDRTTVRKGDILVTIVGANTGDVCRVDREVEDHFVCQSVALARPRMESFSEFLELWLNSPKHGQALYQEWAYGEGRPHLSFDHLRSTPLAVPGAAEQAEIVRVVRMLFEFADTIEKRMSRAAAGAERLSQAILSKAFSGGLVPTEADLARAEGRIYETALELLARTQREGGSEASLQRRRNVRSSRRLPAASSVVSPRPRTA